ncbi:aminoglycoside phosphotransferase family protein [Streptomyces sp. WAC08241]|uniref:aminoglycoside phosphotransferase family protein n=1 Tax=Streptomyces sp. WAC08241 TaxID=2487421 RepID=UPI000F78852E|nr:aminoglycoside phosphotransferase family protein [Streptomyces sp. WAC08241]RSS44014.1 aminoglycoside phosphotransferase family protein [Streptomyces sp. WAC08241]
MATTASTAAVPPVSVDRGRFADAVTPWEDEDWRAAAFAWAERELGRHGLRATGTREVRVRPWSVLVRFRTGPGERDAVWFKAGAPDNAFEAPLGDALARWVPDHVVTPLAVDADRAWSLLPDGGPLFRRVLDAGDAGPDAWERAVAQYARMQRALVPHADRMTALGVPDARTARLPGLFDALVAGNAALDPAARRGLVAGRPRLLDWCAELDAYGVPDSLDHCDLHDGQVLAPAPGRFTFFDWGDAAVGHPFGSLLVPAGAVLERYGPERAGRLRDAYLEPWTDLGPSLPELRRAAALATRLAALGRAASWFRLFPGTPATDCAEASAHWLGELFAPTAPFEDAAV